MLCQDSYRPSIGGDGDITCISDITAAAQDHHNDERRDVSKRLSYSGCTENFKVYLRVRPTTSKNAESTVEVLGDKSIRTTAPESSKRAQYTKTESRVYHFTKVFGPATQNDQLFALGIRPLLDRFFNGDNCALFAYGMTNSGKTHTIQGTKANPGIMPLLINNILEHMRGIANAELNVSMLEVYQDSIYDLLGKKREKLSIRDANGRVEVAKLSTHPVGTTTDALKMMDTAAAKRSKSSTFLNTGSSRSHAVYTITLNRTVESREVSSAFQLIDLAGAERGNRTKATAAQQREANNINTSLMQLWRCLQGVKNKTDLSASQEMIPFRESKLTHLLMPILCRAGMSGVGMVACVNPQADDYDETLSILNNASIAHEITEFVDVNRTAATQLDTFRNSNEGGRSSNSTQNPLVAASLAPSVSSKQISLHELADFKAKQQPAAGQKRRRAESTLAAAPPMATVSTFGSKGGARDSTVHVPPARERPPSRRVASKPTINLAELAASANIAAGSDEVQRLQMHVSLLQEKVEFMVNECVTIEQRVRDECGEQMQEHSDSLLATIRALRAEKEVMETGSRWDMTKSCKKARREQLDQSRVEALELGLRESEEELERAKARHDREAALLRESNRSLSERNFQLEKELRDLRERVQAQQAGDRPSGVSIQQQQQFLPAPQVQAVNVNAPAAAPQQSSSSGAASSKIFSQRFKKSDENAVVFNVGSKPTTTTTDKHPQQRSPARSPLSPLSRNVVDNSPRRAVSPVKHSVAAAISAINNKPAFSVKKVDSGPNSSPQRLRGNMSSVSVAPTEAAPSVMTRLRSMRG